MKTEYLLHKEVDHVLAALTPSNQLVMQTSLHTGLRVGDVLSLRPEQLKKSRFWVTESKTGKKKLVGLPSELRRRLQEQSGKFYVFPNRYDETKHRTRQAVWKDVKRAAKALRLKQNVGPHSFRKVYAVDLYEQFGDIERVRRALNHGELSTTIIYALAAQMLRDKQLKKAYRVGAR